jgi:hypothetical protein
MDFFQNLSNAALGEKGFYKEIKNKEGLFYQALAIIGVTSVGTLIVGIMNGILKGPMLLFTLLFIPTNWLFTAYLMVAHGNKVAAKEKPGFVNINLQQALTVSGFCQVPYLLALCFSWLPQNVTQFLNWIFVIWSMILLFIALKTTFELKSSKAFWLSFTIYFWYVLGLLAVSMMIGYFLKSSGA